MNWNLILMADLLVLVRRILSGHSCGSIFYRGSAMTCVLYQKTQPKRQRWPRSIEYAQQRVANLVVLGLLHSNDPVRARRIAEWERLARIRLRQFRGLPAPSKAQLEAAHDDRQRYTWLATKSDLTPEAKSWPGSLPSSQSRQSNF
jgi:hypothetical protein